MKINIDMNKWAGKKQGYINPEQPTDVAEQRRDGLAKLVAGFRLFAECGYDEGPAGHITYRDPEHTDHFWVNPFGMHFEHIKVSDLLLVNHDGEVVQGDRPLNQAAFAIHSTLHAAHPHINAAAHSHSMAGRTFSTLGRKLRPLTQDACAFFDVQAYFAEFHGVVNDVSYGQNIAEALGSNKVCILQNHGLLTTGTTVDESVWRFIAMDRCCETELLAMQTGIDPISIDDATAALTREQVGSDFASWFSYQPSFDRMLAQHPDLLD